MKQYAGSYRTEEEAALAIKDLEPLLTEDTEVTVLTRVPYAFERIRSGHDARYYTDAPVGMIYHGDSFLEVLTTMHQEHLDEDTMRHLTEKFMDGEILLFLGDKKSEESEAPITPGTYEMPEEEGRFIRPDLKETEVPDRDLEEEDALGITEEEALHRLDKNREPYHGSVDERNPFDPDEPRFIP